LAACQRKRLRSAWFPSKRNQCKRLRLDGNRALFPSNLYWPMLCTGMDRCC